MCWVIPGASSRTCPELLNDHAPHAVWRRAQYILEEVYFCRLYLQSYYSGHCPQLVVIEESRYKARPVNWHLHFHVQLCIHHNRQRTVSILQQTLLQYVFNLHSSLTHEQHPNILLHLGQQLVPDLTWLRTMASNLELLILIPDTIPVQAAKSRDEILRSSNLTSSNF